MEVANNSARYSYMVLCTVFGQFMPILTCALRLPLNLFALFLITGAVRHPWQLSVAGQPVDHQLLQRPPRHLRPEVVHRQRIQSDIQDKPGRRHLGKDGRG